MDGTRGKGKDMFYKNKKEFQNWGYLPVCVDWESTKNCNYIAKINKNGVSYSIYYNFNENYYFAKRD